MREILRLDAALEQAVRSGAWAEADSLADERQTCIARLFSEVDPETLESYRDHFVALLHRDQARLATAQQARHTLQGESSRLREQFSAANQYLNVAHLEL